MSFDYPTVSYCIFIGRHCVANSCSLEIKKLWTLWSRNCGHCGQEIVDTVVLTIDYFSRNCPSYRQFQHFLEEVESEFEVLSIFDSEVLAKT